MKKFFKSPTGQITYSGVKGALTGVLAGLFFGLLIWGLLLAVDVIFPVESGFSVLPASTITFLTMISGSTIGGVFGACACLKKQLREKK